MGHTVYEVPRNPASSLPNAAERDDTFDTAFQLGWDHAQYALTPPLEQLCINPRLQQGFRAGRAAFGRRSLLPTAAVRQWLQLRLAALAQGRTYESVVLTPHFLAQIKVPLCPVTRERLGAESGAVITRLRPDAGYAAGHLVLLGSRAHAAKAELGFADALDRMQQCDAARNGPARIDGLTGEQWARLAVLCSFVVPLPHEAAASLPLRVLPPNRLRLFNPAQALQVSIARALAHETPNKRLAAIRAALPGTPHRDAFDGVLEAYRAALTEAVQARPGVTPHWAVEDAWADRLLQTRWKRFARALTPEQCEAAAIDVAEGEARRLPDVRATEGWALATGGLLPHTLAARTARFKKAVAVSGTPRSVPARAGRISHWPEPSYSAATRPAAASPQAALFPTSSVG